MNHLIPIGSGQLAGEAAQTVNARDLHAFLEVQARFNDWIVRRIEEYDFEEGRDFVAGGFYSNLSKTGFEDGQDFRSNLSKSSGGRPAKDYHLSIDMAKELAMVEKNDKGRQARRYFIECERRAKAATAAFQREGSSVSCPDLADAFLAECVAEAPGGRVQCQTLYHAFEDWCRRNGVALFPSSIAFGRAVSRRFPRYKSNYYWWVGMALRTSIGGRQGALPERRNDLDAAFFLRVSNLSADFYACFREALVRCDALYREHRMMLRDSLSRAGQHHDVSQLLHTFEGAGLSMINAADEALNAALAQMRSGERVWRLAVGTRP